MFKQKSDSPAAAAGIDPAIRSSKRAGERASA